MTLAEFAPRFLTYSDNTTNTPRTSPSGNCWMTLGSRSSVRWRLSAIGAAQIRGLQSHMRKKKSAARARKEAPTRAALLKRGDVEPKPLSLKTINNVLSALSKLLALAQEQGEIAQAPRVKLFGKLPKPTFDFLASRKPRG